MNNKLKIQLMCLLLFAGTNNLYAKEYTVDFDKGEKPHYPKYIAEKDSNNASSPEPRAYKYFGKTIDEINAKKGIKSNYFSKAISNDYDNVDKVVLLKNSEDNNLQVYFGKNNSIDNFKIINESEFENLEKNKKINYVFNGSYEILNNKSSTLDNPTNSLEMSADEYLDKIKDIEDKVKNNELKKEDVEKEISSFVKNKVIDKIKKENIKVFEKNGDLYTEDKSGKEWKIFYTMPKLYTKEQTLQGQTKFEDKIYQSIFFYNDKGTKVIYDKDNSIFVEKDNFNEFHFTGKGKIDGEIDLGGEGKSLFLDSQVPSRFGVNLILGKNAKLKNISKIIVGQDTTGSKNTNQEGELGGLNLNPTALTFDLDENAVNEKGYLYKHVLFNTDEETRNKIEFKAPGYDPYTINLMVSKVNEDKTVDMMKKKSLAGSKWFSYEEDFNVGVFKSDSFTHILDKRTEDKNSDESTLLDIKVRKELKKLNKNENDVYSSIVNSKKIGLLSTTTTTTNKKLFFTDVEKNNLANKIGTLKKYLIDGVDSEKILKDLSDFNFTEKQLEQINKDIEKAKEKGLEIKNQQKEAKRNFEGYEKREKNIENLKDDLNKIKDKIQKFDFDKSSDEEIKNLASEINNMEYIKFYLDNNLEWGFMVIDPNKFSDFAVENYLTPFIPSINKINEYIKSNDIKKAKAYLKGLVADNEIDTALTNIPGLLEKYTDEREKAKEKLDTSGTFNQDKNYVNLVKTLFYNLREEEALNELKTMLTQLQDTNIYSKVNKIAKNEISTYTNLPFDINHDLFKDLKNNKYYAKGGFISSRTVQDNFTGNTYTAYGLYENKLSKKNTLGFMFGGANTNYKKTHNKRTALTTPASSTSKGVSVYAGAYLNKQVKPNLNWISGTGIQYGRYSINRQLKNNYQELVSKGKANLGAINTYTGLIANFPIHEDISFQVKGLLAHTFVNQSKVNEKNGLALNIDSKNYNYIDGEFGVAVTKTLFDYDVKSSLSAGVYGVAGLYGYKNSDLNTKVKDSTSDFKITGDKVKKDAVKIFIDYNVQEETGFNYGLEGTYLSNSEENNVKIGVKAGYVF